MITHAIVFPCVGISTFTCEDIQQCLLVGTEVLLNLESVKPIALL